MQRSADFTKQENAALLSQHRVFLGACIDCGRREKDILVLRVNCRSAVQNSEQGAGRRVAEPMTGAHASIGRSPVAARSDLVLPNDAATNECPFCAEEVKAEAKGCRHCGKSLGGDEPSDGRLRHVFESGKCIHCGTSQEWIATYGNVCILDMSKHVTTGHGPRTAGPKCPKCSSPSLSANKRGFGLGKALVGGALTGGVGLLAGFIGSGAVMVTCVNCGHGWQAGKRK
jgi:hypothetical protein